MSDAELVALAVCQAAIGISSDRHFLGLVEGAARLVSAPARPVAYNCRLRLLVELLTRVQQRPRPLA